MATRSIISIHQNDGVIRSVYCHWDGYYEHNGVVLYNFYDTADKVNKLINHGSISSLGTEIGKKHDFSKIYDGCTFYHRDRNEDKEIIMSRVYSPVNPYYNVPEEEYNYIFVEKTGKWVAKKEYENEYRDLEEIFTKNPPNQWMTSVSNEEQYKKLVGFYEKFGKDVKIPPFEEVSYEI